MSADIVGPETFEDMSLEDARLRGRLHRAAAPSGDGLVLTHGAGGNAASPLLSALAHAFAARGLSVLRDTLPFRQARPAGPPGRGDAPLDRLGLGHATRAMRRARQGKGVPRRAIVWGPSGEHATGR